ncbi:hypothetical protein ACA910_022092 [Epithemia clementina (nom. ined.)]
MFLFAVAIVSSLLCCSTVLDAYSLQGKRALVTGSSAGIGRGIALELGRQGCQVLVHYNTRASFANETVELLNENWDEEDEESIRPCAGILQCDFRNISDLQRFEREIDEIWPEGYDILVNNAGIVGKLALDDDDDEMSHWNEVMAVNLFAPRWLSQSAVSRMKQRSALAGLMATCGGVILHVSSIHGERSNEYVAAYAASKAALDSLTRSMALEYAIHRIRVNAIAPGIIAVERTADELSLPKNRDPWLERLLVGRLGTVEDVAEAAMPLLTNDWITGTIWKVDGGMTARSNTPSRPRPLRFGGFV